jgi:hypothetical protein
MSVVLTFAQASVSEQSLSAEEVDNLSDDDMREYVDELTLTMDRSWA